MLSRNDTKIEIFLVSLISIALLLLIYTVEAKTNEILLNSNSIILRENPDQYIDNLLAKEIIDYKLDAYTMVETYDKDFNIIIRVPLVDDKQVRIFSDLKNHERLKSLFNKYQEGHTKVQIGDHEEDVYFKWTETKDLQKRLTLVYISRSIPKDLWLIPFLCYIVLILVFVLVVKLHISRQKDMIKYYHKTSLRVQEKIINK